MRRILFVFLLFFIFIPYVSASTVTTSPRNENIFIYDYHNEKNNILKMRGKNPQEFINVGEGDYSIELVNFGNYFLLDNSDPFKFHAVDSYSYVEDHIFLKFENDFKNKLKSKNLGNLVIISFDFYFQQYKKENNKYIPVYNSFFEFSPIDRFRSYVYGNTIPCHTVENISYKKGVWDEFKAFNSIGNSYSVFCLFDLSNNSPHDIFFDLVNDDDVLKTLKFNNSQSVDNYYFSPLITSQIYFSKTDKTFKELKTEFEALTAFTNFNDIHFFQNFIHSNYKQFMPQYHYHKPTLKHPDYIPLDSFNDIFDNIDDPNGYLDFFKKFQVSNKGVLTQIIFSPMHLYSSLPSSIGKCNNLELLIMSKNIKVPSGCFFWSKADSTVVVLYQMIVFGYLSYRILYRIVKLNSKLLNPNNNDVEVLKL